MNHLIPAAAAELDRPAEERISRLRRPAWIGYTRAQSILDQLEHLLRHPGTHRMPNLLLVGDTNNGKTMLIRRFVEQHPAEPGEIGSTRRLLLIQAPPVPDERRLYFAILDALHAPYSPSGLTAAKMTQVVTVLRKVGVRMLIIDEIHHLMAGHLEKQRQFLNVLKYLSNEFSMSEGTIGELANLLSIAAAAAIRTGQEQIDGAVLKQIGWIRPSERKASIERMAG